MNKILKNKKRLRRFLAATLLLVYVYGHTPVLMYLHFNLSAQHSHGFSFKKLVNKNESNNATKIFVSKEINSDCYFCGHHFTSTHTIANSDFSFLLKNKTEKLFFYPDFEKNPQPIYFHKRGPPSIV